MSRLLLIGPNFFEYMLVLKHEIEQKGYKVDYVDDRPKFGLLGKSLLRLFPSKMGFFVDRYVDNIIANYSSFKYDKILVILGQSFNQNHVKKLKSVFKDSVFIYYARDSVKNFKNIKDIYGLFDYAYTFDPDDALKLKNFTFLPLFFSPTYIKKKDFVDKTNKALLIMTIKKGKLEHISPIINVLKKSEIQYKPYLFLQSRLVYLYYKITDKSFRNYKCKDFIYKRLPYQQCLSLMNDYKYIIDIPMAGQKGLTIRTFETLNLQSKLITTNCDITKYDFYSDKDILVFNEKTSESNLNSFFSSNNFENLNLEKYSVSSFLDVLLDLK